MKKLLIQEKIHDPVTEKKYSYDAYTLCCAVSNLEKAEKWIENAHKLAMMT
jgi:hypothetical protein